LTISRHNRERRNNLPPITHEYLRQLVIDCESLLVERWAAHEEGDILVLADLDRDGFVRFAIEQLGPSVVQSTRDKAAEEGTRPMIALLQPEGYPAVLAKSGDFAHREAAKELRSFAAMSWTGIVPLLVLLPGGLWATQWATPGSNAFVHRYEPATTADAN
jgi:hypothetical protein